MSDVAARSGRLLGLLIIGLVAASGCDSFERKFIRQRKYVRPSPVIQFQDYSKGATPLDRYRKHALLFDYWNDLLLQELNGAMNLKRARRVSKEALGELGTLESLLQEPSAAELTVMKTHWQKVDGQLQDTKLVPSNTDAMRRELERQTREFERHFSWKDVQDKLQPAGSEEPAGAGVTETTDTTAPTEAPPTDASGH